MEQGRQEDGEAGRRRGRRYGVTIAGDENDRTGHKVGDRQDCKAEVIGKSFMQRHEKQ